jgi:hypothetical protein
VFTLAPAGSVSAIVALPNGDLVYAVRGEHDVRRDMPGRLMRLTPDGVLREVRADGAYLLAAESASSVVRVPEPSFGQPSVHAVERVDVVTGRVTQLSPLPGEWTGDFSRSFIVRIGPDGAVTRLLAPPARPSTALGNGDGLQLFRDELPTGMDEAAGAMAVGDDGSLIFSEDTQLDQPSRGLRALVPAASPRPRIALTQESFTTFERGVIHYTASRVGTVSAGAQRHRGTVGLQGRGQLATAGDGELALSAPPSPGRYTLRLRLDTSLGGAATVVHLDTRRVLPLREARRPLKEAFEFGDGDEGGSEGMQRGECHRRTPRVIRCLLLHYLDVDQFDGPEVGRWSEANRPAAWVTATLLNDGIHTAERWLPGSEDTPETCLAVAARRHQHLGGGQALIIRVRSACRCHVRVAAHLHWRVNRHTAHAIQIRARALRPGLRWVVALALPRRARIAMRAGRHVRGDVIVRAKLPTRYGPITEEHGIPGEVGMTSQDPRGQRHVGGRCS